MSTAVFASVPLERLVSALIVFAAGFFYMTIERRRRGHQLGRGEAYQLSEKLGLGWLRKAAAHRQTGS